MYSHHSRCTLDPNRTASISHYYRAWLLGYMCILVKFKEQRWDVHGHHKEFARVGRTFDVRMSCGLYNIHRRTSASLVPLWKWWVHHYSSGVVAWCRSGKMTQTRCLFIRNWNAASFRLPEAPELRDRYMIMIAPLSLCTVRTLHFDIMYSHCRRVPLISYYHCFTRTLGFRSSNTYRPIN